MRNPSFISSFSPARSAVPWVLALFALIELRVARLPPSPASLNVVDDVLARLDRPPVAAAPVTVIGDSVANQLVRELRQQRRTAAEDLTANAAIETPGHYLLLRRRLEQRPRPARVVFMSENPDFGKLTNPYVDNHVVRCFLRWDEIADLTLGKRDAAFGLRMSLHRLSPTLRRRAELQAAIPYFHRPGSAAARMAGAGDTGGDAGSNALTGLMDYILRRRSQDEHMAARYFTRLVRELHGRGIPLHFVPTPRAGDVAAPAVRPLAAVNPVLHRRLEALAAQYSSFTFEADVRYYPRDWFGDGTHFKAARLADAAADLAGIMNIP